MTNYFDHHMEHLLIYSVVIWQIVLGIWLLFSWLVKNVRFGKNTNTILGIEKSLDNFSSGELFKNTKKDLGPIEVDIKKQISIDKADISDLKSDEVKKGKVKTQKDKLRSLRG